MRALEHLEPERVFHYFEEICRIPHGSGNTRQISDYLAAFAAEHGLQYRQETCGNVIIRKPAAPGYEQADLVMLQGHMDMVAVKTRDCDLDLEKEGLRPAVTGDGKWVYAEGTSLGGDDGIAVAYALAILEDDTLIHPELEVVLTVDEEIGLLGASALDAGDLRSRILLNMDSEDDGIFLTSCAGGATVECLAEAPSEEVSGVVYEWRVEGLQGGHSGSDIHLGRANANLIFGRFLAQVSETAEFSVGDFAGGEKDNAIASGCRAIFVAAPSEARKLEHEAEIFAGMIRAEYAGVDPGMNLVLDRLEQNHARILTSEGKKNLMTLLEHLPSGIQRMMPEMPEMVQTSLNLGVLRLKGTEISLTYSVRSSSAAEKAWLIKRMRNLCGLTGGRCRISGEYPAWEFRADSRIQRIMAETYEEMTGEKPVLTGIHAGVECGILSEKLPGIDCISYGPQMKDIHTPRERLEIASVKKNYELTLRVLEKLAKKNSCQEEGFCVL